MERRTIETKNGPVEKEKFVPITQANDDSDSNIHNSSAQDDDRNIFHDPEYQDGTADEVPTAVLSDNNKTKDYYMHYTLTVLNI